MSIVGQRCRVGRPVPGPYGGDRVTDEWRGVIEAVEVTRAGFFRRPVTIYQIRNEETGELVHVSSDSARVWLRP